MKTSTTGAVKTLVKISKDPRIEEAWDEGEDGYWFVCKPGWKCVLSGCHAGHEHTARALLDAFATVEPCDCEDCKAEKMRLK